MFINQKTIAKSLWIFRKKHLTALIKIEKKTGDVRGRYQLKNTLAFPFYARASR
jgi:hypothetical protein